IAAQHAAAALMADPARRDAVVGCTPKSPDDAACFAKFVSGFARKAFRRLPQPDEMERLNRLQSFSVEDGDFYSGVEAVVTLVLQMPEVLFVIERGTPVGDSTGPRRLNGDELASRLSFLLWGGPPDQALLDAAEQGKLDSSDGLKAEAKRLLA